SSACSCVQQNLFFIVIFIIITAELFTAVFSCEYSVCGCDSTEAVIRLVVTALVGVAAAAAVVVLVYDIRSRRDEQNL
ncbi:hypothetical protein cypCar_00048035, partial [Cyprinus carpio]